MFLLCTDTAPSDLYTLSLHDALPILGRQEFFVDCRPARADARAHAHGMQRLGVAARGFRQRLALASELGDGLLRPARHQRSEEHTSELQSLRHLVCRLLLEKKKVYT